MTSAAIEQLDDRIRAIPGLPSAVLDVLRLTDDADVDLGGLEAAINRDQGLAARILRVANSPFYGLSGRISVIKEACILLGVHTIRSVAIAAGTIDRFAPNPGGAFDRKGLWRHAIGVASAASVVAARTGQDRDAAFTAGLLHDIGKLVLDVYFPEEFARVLRYREANECLLREAEAKVLGFDHALVGARLAEHWKLPCALVRAVADHHTTVRGEDFGLTDVVHVADVLARALEIGDGGDDLIPRLESCALERLGVATEDLADCLAEIDQLAGTATWLD